MLLDQLGVVGLKSVLASPAPHDEPHLCGSRLAEGQQGHEPLSPAQEPFSTASAMSSHRIRYSATAAPNRERVPEPCRATWMDSAQHPSAQCFSVLAK